MNRMWQQRVSLKLRGNTWLIFEPTLGPEFRIQNGSVLDCEVKGLLPYSLRFKLEVTSINSPKSMAYNAEGHLKGTGRLWKKLMMREQLSNIGRRYDSSIFNLISKIGFMKRAMERNHNRVTWDFLSLTALRVYIPVSGKMFAIELAHICLRRSFSDCGNLLIYSRDCHASLVMTVYWFDIMPNKFKFI